MSMEKLCFAVELMSFLVVAGRSVQSFEDIELRESSFNRSMNSFFNKSGIFRTSYKNAAVVVRKKFGFEIFRKFGEAEYEDQEMILSILRIFEALLELNNHLRYNVVDAAGILMELCRSVHGKNKLHHAMSAIFEAAATNEIALKDFSGEAVYPNS